MVSRKDGDGRGVQERGKGSEEREERGKMVGCDVAQCPWGG
jgi:hypothetical protein